MNVQEYCDSLNLQIEVTYYPNQKGRWCAKFHRCETKEDALDCCLTGSYGNGKTPLEAISNYIDDIRGKILVVNSYGSERREYIVPESLTVQ